jgi:hypothetical protein
MANLECWAAEVRVWRGQKVNSGAERAWSKKGAAIAGGSKSKQGGVKQSGQEPLDVQKMDVSVMVAKA